MGRYGVVVVAAGTGSRMQAPVSKQYLLLQGKPIVVHTLERLQQMAHIEAIVLVTGHADVERCSSYVTEYKLTKVCAVTVGGEQRQHSVYRGLQLLPASINIVAVHDGVRPFVTEASMMACLQRAEQDGAAVVAVRVKDTIKVVDDAGYVQATPDRESLWAVQTPQAFQLDLLIDAHERAAADGIVGTDDAMLVERMGAPVCIVEGTYTNIKITTPDDLLWADRILQQIGEEG